MKKPYAVFTICKNEQLFLPIFLNYYSRFFDPQDIYVIDHESDDGSTDNLTCNKVVWYHPVAFDHRAVTDRVEAMQAELLERYEVVLFVEIDEIICPKIGLNNYLYNFLKSSKEVIKCNGYDIINMPDEDELILSLPILSQRKYWFHNPTFQCKPNLSKIPLKYEYGFHNAQGVSEVDEELIHLHLNRFDYKLAYERNLDRQKFKFHEGDKAAGSGFQKHLIGEAFKDWFYNFRFNVPVTEIPLWLRESGIV